MFSWVHNTADYYLFQIADHEQACCNEAGFKQKGIDQVCWSSICQFTVLAGDVNDCLCMFMVVEVSILHLNFNWSEDMCVIRYFLRRPVKKGVWSEEEVEQLRALYEEYKNSLEQQGNPSVLSKEAVMSIGTQNRDYKNMLGVFG